MRYTPKTIEEVRRCVASCSGETWVEVDDDIPVKAKTVADLRALSSWPPGNWVLDVLVNRGWQFSAHLVYDAAIAEIQRSKIERGVMRRNWCINILVNLAALGFYLGASPTFAQIKKCTCDFAESKWEAYGTKAVCATFMHKGRTSCEVEFGGFGADPNVISAIGGNPAYYQTEQTQALTRYFLDVQNNNRDDLFDPKFLQTILPILMRGAYLRPMADVSIGDIKRLDSAVVSFLNKNSSDVSDIFRGLKSPFFGRPWDEAKIDVGRGFMTVDHPAGRISVIYFSPE